MRISDWSSDVCSSDLAVCIWPRFVTHARGLLQDSGVRIAAVANFPAGGDDIASAVRETADIVSQGGDEVDLVMPYTRWLGGDVAVARDMIASCKGACGERVLLKIGSASCRERVCG